jgi:hypothetical protein
MSTPATRRINRGRGHTYLLDGDQADGVTAIVGDGVPKRALIDWAARTTAGYAVDHWDELAQASPSERLRTLEKARFADLRAAGARGTDIHSLAVQLQAGQEVDVPEPLLGHVDAYLEFTNDWQPQELVVETVILNRKHRYMGTLDLIAELADQQTWLLDWKTTGSGIWSESALQLAAYRNAESFVTAEGTELAMPEVDRCGCVWLRADGYDLIPVDAGPDTFRMFLYAQQMAHFTRAQREQYIHEALQPPGKEEAA